MIKFLNRLRLASGLTLAGLCLMFSPAQAQTSDPLSLSWEEITKQAQGQTVYFNAWGGGEASNNYIAWAGEHLAEQGITLQHVKLSDTALAVRQVLAEKTVGRDTDGAIDMIWINGENFKSMKEAGLLFGPFTEKLPNWQLADPAENANLVTDFTVPTDGYEMPWGQARLVVLYDQERLANPPRDLAALLAHAKENPGRLTYPAPPDFTGSTFLKQLLIMLTPEPEALKASPDPETFERISAPLWDYLEQLTPYLWRKGQAYPQNKSTLREMLNALEVDLSFSFDIGEAATAIENGQLPESTRTYVFEGGTIGNSHFLAIPYNSPHKAAALVTANFLLSAKAQAHKQDPRVWGDRAVLSMNKLGNADKSLFDELPTHPALLSQADLGPALSEPHPDWMSLLEQKWLEIYGG